MGRAFRQKSKNGSYKYKSVYGKTYCEVKERMNELLLLSCYSSSNDGTVSIHESEHLFECSTPKIIFSTVADQWLTHIEEARKYSTYIKYLKLYDHYIRESFSETYILDISNELLSEKILEDRFSPNLRYSIVSVINQILKYANEFYNCSSVQLPNKRVKYRNEHIEIILDKNNRLF